MITQWYISNSKQECFYFKPAESIPRYRAAAESRRNEPDLCNASAGGGGNTLWMAKKGELKPLTVW